MEYILSFLIKLLIQITRVLMTHLTSCVSETDCGFTGRDFVLLWYASQAIFTIVPVKKGFQKRKMAELTTEYYLNFVFKLVNNEK